MNSYEQLDDQVILLTGGTGSFGRAFVKEVLQKSSATIRIFSRDELKQHDLSLELENYNDRIRFFLGDVRDKPRLTRAAKGANILIHAAALKQVPACEYNPFEAVQTNVVGAENVVDAAIDAQVAKVIAVSTDKAVNPVNLYGATKLCAEKIIVQGNAYASRSETKLSCVRYGNVVGSRGSVLPLFLKQKASGCFTITDTRMTRFWITLPQAVELVITALSIMKGGEIFIPKIPSMKVTDLARAISPDAKQNVVGIRAGEKLHEILLTSEESRHAVERDGMYVIFPEHPWWGVDRSDENDIALPEGMVYSSDSNEHWLTSKEIETLIR